jgi:hypothetical protein
MACSASVRADSIVSTFDSDLDGWTHAGGGDAGTTVTWLATGGTGGGGGAILTDVAGGAADYFTAPSKFLGNDLAFEGGSLSFDLKVSSAVGAPNDQSILLNDNSQAVRIAILPPPSAVGFTSYSVKLDPSAGWIDFATNLPVTQTEFDTILGNLTSLRILGDWVGGKETTNLDNVEMATTTPLPPAVTGGGVLLAAIAALQMRNRHRRTYAFIAT